MIVCSLQDESQFHYNNWLLLCFFRYVSRPVDCLESNLSCPSHLFFAAEILLKEKWINWLQAGEK